MSRKKQRLELTWIGKDERPKLEPRILLEETEASSNRQFAGGELDNCLIHGDNLLALKALEGGFSGTVDCIYIDPPFNTQQAMAHYDDGLEHSLWLSLMRDRIEVLSCLLAKSGTIFVHIDDNELGYLITLMDDIFGRSNRLYVITFKQGAPTGHKSINPGCVTTTNFLLMYCKDREHWRPNRVFTGRERDKRYNQVISNIDGDVADWSFSTLQKAFAAHLNITDQQARKFSTDNPEALDEFVESNANRVIRFARPDYESVSQEARNYIDSSKADRKRVLCLKRDKHSDMYFVNGERILFYKDKMKLVDGLYVSGEPLTTLWDDILSNNLHNEGGVSFPKGKKPEHLLKRVIELSTKPGDLVLDSFAGSGTTGAVAHKMRRRWIMVESGEHCQTHIIPRLRSVIDGSDRSGVTEATGWKGGGGFRYFRLAPSLLEKDRWGNWVIARSYNPAMLAEAMCKHMGFTYAPSQDPAEYWRHGHSSERDFIFITTANVTHDQLRAISEDVGPERTLLVCCKAFNARAEAFENLTVKKIPQAVLSRCEWGRDDYSLRIAEVSPLPEESASPASPEAGPPKRERRVVSTSTEPSLFSAMDAKGAGK